MSVLKSDSKFKLNYKNPADGLDLIRDLADSSIAVSFFDPQYRGVLDKLNYGNEGVGRGKERCSLPQMDEDTIKSFIKGINRVLRDSGYLFLWVDKFHLCEGVHNWIQDTGLHIVDMIVWDKLSMGMGYRTRRTSEYLLVLQKEPLKAKYTWNDHGIPDVWNEKKPKSHPHSKPIGLQQRLIAATTTDGDVVLDAAAGGYSVLEACELVGRDFIGCDIQSESEVVV